MRNGQNSDISVIVPAYNEEAYVGKVLDGLLALDFFREIVAVDDGSRDGTSQILAGYRGHEGIAVISNEKNMGKGCAVIRGLGGITASYVVLQDADLEYPVENLKEITRHRGYDMVAGVRVLSGAAIAKMTIRSFLINKMFIRLLGTSDAFTGQRMLEIKFIRSLHLRSRGFELETEITAKAIRRGASVKYVPIEYKARSSAEGKKIGPRDLFKIFFAYLSLKANLF